MAHKMRIKELREAANLTQQQLADSMGVVRSAVANWETGSSMPKTSDLCLLACLLRCDYNALFVDQPGLISEDKYTA